ncbi:MAG: helix-hairpin-helix domain-containing protein [Acidimicrobiia bacterium]
MHEPPRPEPAPTITERVHASITFLGPGRLLSAGLSILLVAAGCWWLLRAPAPPVEAQLPFTAGAGAAGGSEAAAAPGSATTSTLASPPSSAAPAGTIVVQAAGAVAVPGVYTLPAGSRVHELVAMAGGVTPDGDPAAIALAVVLTDGERVYVPRVGEVVPAAPAGPAVAGSGAIAPAGPLDLNRATAEQLDALPGVGPTTAAAIVAHRERNGPFASIDGLLDVRGIGPAKLDALRDLVTV